MTESGLDILEGQPIELSTTQLKKGVRTTDAHWACVITRVVSKVMKLNKQKVLRGTNKQTKR